MARLPSGSNQVWPVLVTEFAFPHGRLQEPRSLGENWHAVGEPLRLLGEFFDHRAAARSLATSPD